jgi:hypothetical protein
VFLPLLYAPRVLVDIYGVDAVVKDDINGGASSEMRGFYSSFKFNVRGDLMIKTEVAV